MYLLPVDLRSRTWTTSSGRSDEDSGDGFDKIIEMASGLTIFVILLQAKYRRCANKLRIPFYSPYSNEFENLIRFPSTFFQNLWEKFWRRNTEKSANFRAERVLVFLESSGANLFGRFKKSYTFSLHWAGIFTLFFRDTLFLKLGAENFYDKI